MNDRLIDVELLWYKVYWVESIEDQKKYNIIESNKEYNIIPQEWRLYNILELPVDKTYWVSYCIKYRPLWLSERILERWWWNDKWIWTADWIFNDWIL